LFGLILVKGNLLPAYVVGEGLSPVHVEHHDLLTRLWWPRVSGRWHRLQGGCRVKLMDEDSDGFLSASRTNLRQDVHCNVVVADDVVELETINFFSSLRTSKQ
jgi:hypothetical protein